LVNAERFTSTELKEYERKILAADERILEIERQLFIDVRSSVAAKAARLRRTAAAVAQMTCSQRSQNWRRIVAIRGRNSTQPGTAHHRRPPSGN